MAANIDSLKEYYIKLQNMYENAVNMLTAINTSLSTSAPEITVDVLDNDNTFTTVRVPSFIYLESKIEEIENNISNLFKLPQSGEAWFNRSSDMFKLNLLKTGIAPNVPEVLNDENNLNSNQQYTDIIGGIKDNTFLKDLVTPKTYLTLTLNNVGYNIEKVFVKKIVVHNASMYSNFSNRTGLLEIKTYNDFIEASYGYQKQLDWEEYDSEIQVPIKRDKYVSHFEIVDIINQWSVKNANNNYVENYTLQFNTLHYYDKELNNITNSLKVGDKLYINDTYSQYIIIDIDLTTNGITIQEITGHKTLQKTSENNSIFFKLYEDYSNNTNVEIPLEENQYIILMIAAVYNNVRSEFSKPLFLDLSKLPIKIDGEIVSDYLTYYKKYCKNIGDILDGIIKEAMPQLTDFSSSQLSKIRSEEMQLLINNTVINDINVKVVPINKHLSDDKSSEDLKELHLQKSEINSQLQALSNSINDNYSKLISGDFKEDNTISQKVLQDDINKMYSERTVLEKQLISIINNINSKAEDAGNLTSSIKYRIRGEADIVSLEKELKNVLDDNVNIVGLDLEYKYKSSKKDTSKIDVINGTVFSDWNKLVSIDKERELKFSTDGNLYEIIYVEPNPLENSIKWNQIDIPITAGEDVIIRVRYKLNIGQPFINIYTNFSEDIEVSFPTEYLEELDTVKIIETNKNDSINAMFTSKLINDGYEEHIKDKTVTQDVVFLHTPDTIYSGFNTPENTMLSLRDKLNLMLEDIQKYKDFIEEEYNSNFDVQINIDNQLYNVSKNTINTINIYNTEHINDTYIRKDCQIIIRNTGKSRLKLFSIFPGNSSIPLPISNIKSQSEQIINYDRFPLHTINKLYPQYLNQWIYFRTTNPYTNESIFDIDAVITAENMKNGIAQNLQESNDYNIIIESQDNDSKLNNLKFIIPPVYYISSDKQVQLPLIKRNTDLNVTAIETLGEHLNNLNELIIKYPLMILNDYVNWHKNTIEIQPALFYDNMTNVTDVKFDSIFNKVTNEDVKKLFTDVPDTEQSPEYVTNKLIKLNSYIHKISENILNKSVFNQYMSFNKNNYLPFYIYGNSRYSEKWIKESYKYNQDELDNDVFVGDPSIHDTDKYNIYSNKFLMKYEDIVGYSATDELKAPVYLDNETSISAFNTNNIVEDFNDTSDKLDNYNGAFLFTNFIDRTIINLEENSNVKYIEVGDSISIPIVFEYYINKTEESKRLKSVSKSLYFDIKRSLIDEPIHFMIEFVGHTDYSSTSNIYTNIENESTFTDLASLQN